MMGIFDRKARKQPIELQLTALIDVMSMLVIFLIKGTVFGASDMLVPNDMKLPESVSRESAESAPQVIISKSKVSVSFSKETYDLSAFRDNGGPTGLRKQLKAYVAALPAVARTSGVLLNVVADKLTPYKDVFDTVKVFREAGFETLLFVATVPGKAEKGQDLAL